MILVFKFNSFLSFVIVSLAVGLAEGMTIDDAVVSIENGIGSTMGFLVLILGFGSMLGKLVSESGAAQRITSKLVNAFGIKHIQLALMLTGFIVGISLFYDVGFFIMIPLVFTVAASTGLPLTVCRFADAGFSLRYTWISSTASCSNSDCCHVQC